MEKFTSDYLKNNTKTIFFGLSLPQKKCLRLLLRQILRQGSGLLRVLGDCGKGLPKTVGQKFSYHLGKISLLKPVEDFADRRLVRFLKPGTVIAYDLTDISKPSAKKIEKIGGTFDGSQRRRSRGFFVHGVGFGKFLWRLRLHDGKKDFLPQIRKQILEKLIQMTKKYNPIFAFDRGNDDGKLFAYLLRKSVRFIVRLKSDRKVIIEETGEICSVESLVPGRYTVLIQDGETKQIKKPEKKKYHRFLLIIHQHKKHKYPIRLLCSLDLNSYSDLKLVKLYLKRWGVENSFKQIKRGLNLEEIRVLKFKKFQNLVSLIHLGSLLNEFLFQTIQTKHHNTLKKALSQIKAHYQKFCKTFTRTINSHSFLCFLRTILPNFVVHKKFPKPQSQISLLHFLNEKLKTS